MKSGTMYSFSCFTVLVSIQNIFLKHAHDDHAGFLNEVLSAIDAKVHTADHISLLVEDKLFCGDTAMNNFPSTRRITIWIEDLEKYKQSWYKLLSSRDIVTLYPAHGKPFGIADIEKYLPYLDKIKLHPLRHGSKQSDKF